MKTIRNTSALVLMALVLGQSIETSAQAISRQAKGTIIGAGAGAAAGAIINKRNRAVGGAVGGVLGGAAGYAIGKQGKKRWSPQAKGTVIGAGVGGAAGAVINKRNRAVGGVVGGVAGGAAGYAIGKHIDNKNKARIAAAERAERAAVEREAAARAAGQSSERSDQPVLAATSTKTVNGRAVQPVALLAAQSTQSSFVLSEGYLANNSFGDPTAPYGTSEYRRKSW